VAIRVRGERDASQDVEDTLNMLHLVRNCHAVLIDDRPSYIGMLNKAQHYVTWGEISTENITFLIKERGKIVGDKKLSVEYLKEVGYKTVENLAEAIQEGKVEYSRLPKIKPVFRLRPPKKGYKGKVKKSFIAGGATGYRGEAINEIIERMI
jgi:large subunit ribosomal protein L30